jgi:hypothetical protein
MDGFELHMGERRLDQRRHGLGLVVEEALKRRQAIRHRIVKGLGEANWEFYRAVFATDPSSGLTQISKLTVTSAPG